MTLVTYEPELPALEFVGHAGAGLRGSDPICAALSMLMYTLIEACPEARVRSGDGYCRIEGSGRERASFDVVLGGLRLLAESYPAHVRLIDRSGKGGEHERRKTGMPDGGQSAD